MISFTVNDGIGRLERTVAGTIRDWSLLNSLRLPKILCKLFYESAKIQTGFSSHKVSVETYKLLANNFVYKQNIIKISSLLLDGNYFSKYRINPYPFYSITNKNQNKQTKQFKTTYWKLPLLIQGTIRNQYLYQHDEYLRAIRINNHKTRWRYFSQYGRQTGGNIGYIRGVKYSQPASITRDATCSATLQPR